MYILKITCSRELYFKPSKQLMVYVKSVVIMNTAAALQTMSVAAILGLQERVDPVKVCNITLYH